MAAVRLELRCSCGGEIVVVYEVEQSNRLRSSPEQAEAQKHIDKFRRAHRACLRPSDVIEGQAEDAGPVPSPV